MTLGFKRVVTGLFALLLSANAFASKTKIELAQFVGYTFTEEIVDIRTGDSLSLSSDPNFGLSFAWQDSPTGQGRILVDYSSHDYKSQLDASDKSLDILYAHFSGVAHYRQRSYVTTVGLGLGGAHFKTDEGSDLFPSLTVSVGTRYEFTKWFALVTELRANGSLVDTESEVFCEGETCSATFADSLFVDTSVWLGVAFRF